MEVNDFSKAKSNFAKSLSNGLKFHDTAKKQEKPIEVKENKVWYPSISLKEKNVPELKALKLEDEVTIVCKATVKSTSEYNQQGLEVSFDITEVAITKTPEVKDAIK